MNKKYIIQKNEEIQNVYNNKDKKVVSKCFVIYIKKNQLGYNKYCISVSKKIGKANVRNLFKRRIKDILIKNNFKNSNDYVIILRNAILEKKYLELQEELIKLIKGE